MKTHSAIGSTEGIDGKLYISDKDKSNALYKFFSNVFMTEDPNTVYQVHKNNEISLSRITVNPSVVFEKLSSLKCGIAPGPCRWLAR